MLTTKSNDRKVPWMLLSIEAALIVMSVLLAFVIKSWREARANEALAQRAIQGVAFEVEGNCALIEQFHEYHERVARDLIESTGIQIGSIRNDAWSTAQSTGAAAHIPFDMVAKIERVHALQNDHRTIVASYIQAFFTGLTMGHVTESEMHGIAEIYVIREMVEIQNNLLIAYRELESSFNLVDSWRTNVLQFCPE